MGKLTVGDYLRISRKKHKGLTQQKLAELSGFSRTYISDVENNYYSPSNKFILKVHEAIVTYGSLKEYESKALFNNLLKAQGLEYRKVGN